MAAVAFESSLGASAMRPPLSSADAPSMADSLPSVQFGFEDLRERMQRFTARFDEFIERGRKRVLDERNQFRMNIAELQEDQRMKKQDIEILTLKQDTHLQTLSKESQETAEMHSQIRALTTQRDDRLSARDSLKAQIADVQSQLAARRAAQASHKKYLDSQARYNAPELEFWESHLGLRIEGAGLNDRLKFVFTNVCEKDYEREAWFELDTGSREYGIVNERPKLEREEIERALEVLNDGRVLGPFLKRMRGLFVEAMKA